MKKNAIIIKFKRHKHEIPHYCTFIGDIIHLIGYYPSANRPATTTTTTVLPPFHNPNKPYYYYPSHGQNDWNSYNSYESNNIPGSSYPSYSNSPVSSPPSNSMYNYNNNNNNNNNHHHQHNNYGGNSGGFMDDMGYSITPSPVTNNNNDYNRPHSTASRPTNTYNDYQSDDHGSGYSFGSYQGKRSTL